MGNDRIEISALQTTALIGVLPHERDARQPLQVDLSIDVDLSRAGESDDLNHTVDYGAVCDQVVALIETSEFLLLERLAEAIAQLVLTFANVEGVEVRVTKLRPPIAAIVDTTAVVVTRFN